MHLIPRDKILALHVFAVIDDNYIVGRLLSSTRVSK